MIISKRLVDIRNILGSLKIKSQSIGFVPTMGALHNGHLALIKACKTKNEICVCSIFVNPTQFNNKKDFEKYPITLTQDIQMLETSGCDILFLPSVSEIYPPGYVAPHYELGNLETILEGKFRQGHFQGVCQVVDRLLQIIEPNNLFLGQKDYQQCMLIKKLIALKSFPTQVITVPTVRENNKLALSSRNMRLSATEIKKAEVISEVLYKIKRVIKAGSLNELKAAMQNQLKENGFVVDYLEIADADTLEPIEAWDGKNRLVALVAAYLGEVRLIDNMLLNE
ncbi:MAG: pantoate--beta-alanine ligase [Niastella sp.]|nr:pantoate--beta-alanine ligase [Niastella sp.]